MSGGRVELGIGAGWYDDEHAAYAIPFPPDRRAVRAARGPARDHHRAVGDPGRHDRSRYKGTHLSVVDSPGAAQAGAAAPPADHHRRLRPEAHAPARGRLRRRVQHAVPAGEGRPGHARQHRRRLRGQSAATRRRSCARRPSSSAAAPTRRRSPAGPRRSAGSRPSCAQNARGRHARPRWSTRSAAYAEVGITRAYLQVLDQTDLDHLHLLAAEVLGRTISDASHGMRRWTSQPVVGAGVAEAVVEAAGPALPELDLVGHEPVAAPVRRRGTSSP